MKNRLIQFGGKAIKPFIEQIKGKKVCYVLRKTFLGNVPIVEAKLPFVQWHGATEDEYFISTFYGGIVTLDLNEREMLLGKPETVIVVALVKSLETLNKSSTTSEQFSDKVNLNCQYINSEYKKDLDTIRFSDIMKIIGWKFVSRKVKEEDHFLNDSFQ